LGLKFNIHDGQDAKGLISFTFDTWTSDSGKPYLSITGHYISAPADKPLDWKLKVDQLAFAPFEGCHSGANMSKILVHTVDRYSIRNRVTQSLLCFRLITH